VRCKSGTEGHTDPRGTRTIGFLGEVAPVSEADAPRVSGSRPLYGLAFPLATLLFAFIMLRSVALALVRGGIRWRGTFYPLEALRANRV
jgi:hypothetical protein